MKPGIHAGLVASLSGALLISCAGTPILPGLSTAASMQIEVDVYKGPLSRTLTTQLMEAEGVLSGARDQLSSFLNENWGFYPTTDGLSDIHIPNYQCRAHAGLEPEEPQTDGTADTARLRLWSESRRERGIRASTKTVNGAATPPDISGKDTKKKETNRQATLQLCYDTVELAYELNNLKRRFEDAAHDVSDLAKAVSATVLDIEGNASDRRGQCKADHKNNDAAEQQCRDKVMQSLNTAQVRTLRAISLESSEARDYESYATWLEDTDSTIAGFVELNDEKRKLTAVQARRIAERLRELDQLSARDSLRLMRLMDEKAWYWNTNELARGKGSYSKLYAHFGQLVSDYANLIGSRTDTTLKQNEKGLRAEDLSTADHLRDVAPTAYLNLYDWLSTDRQMVQAGGRSYGPVFTGRGTDGLTAHDRVRMAERLFDDRYWTNINRVFASGQGEVRMAFVRDEIGNWNLKSFQNDPEKLLDAYRDAAIAGVNLVTRVAKATNPSKELLKVAGAFSEGNVNTVQAVGKVTNQIDTARKDTQERLKKLKDAFEQKKAEREKALTDATADVTSAKATQEVQKNTLADQVKALAATDADLATARAKDPQDTGKIASLETQRTQLLAQLNTTRADLATATEKLQTATSAEQAARKVIRESGEAAIRDAITEIETYQRILGVTATMAAGSGK